MFHVKHEGWTESAGALGIELPPGAPEQLSTFEDLLLTRGAPMGLVAPGDVPRLRERHFLDSLRGARLIEPGDRAGYDLGSGGGLPGIVIAIARPAASLVLVEVRRNRAAFLTDAVRELGLANVVVYPRRAETLRERRDVCLARAFAPLARTWELAGRLLRPGGRLLYWAGVRFDPERDIPPGVTVELHTSSLEGAGAIVEVFSAL